MEFKFSLPFFLLFSQLYSMEATKDKPWPDFSCHPLYNPEVIQTSHELCEFELKNNTNYTHSMKTCMLTAINLLSDPIFEVDEEMEVEAPKSNFTYWRDQDYLFPATLDYIIGEKPGVEVNPEVVKKAQDVKIQIMERLQDNCQDLFNKVQKLPDKEWTGFYDCVNKAVGCQK